MRVSRRGIFGLFAAAPAAVVAGEAEAKAELPKPQFFVGEIRARVSHYETKIVPSYQTWSQSSPPSHTHAISQMVPTTEAVAVIGYEQWDGERWVTIDLGPGANLADAPPSKDRP